MDFLPVKVPEPGRRAESKARTHDRILDAVAELVVGTSERLKVRDIAVRADVSHATFYLHFGSVENAVYELRNRVLEHLASAFAEADDLHSGISAYMRQAAAQRGLISALWKSHRARGITLATSLAGQLPEVFSRRDQVKARGDGQVTGAAQPSFLALAVALMVESSVVQAVLADDPLQMSPLGAVLASLIEQFERGSLSAVIDSALPAASGRLVVGERSTSASEFSSRIQRARTMLKELGLRVGDPVCVLLHNGQAYLEMLLALTQSSMTVVPLSTYWRTSEVQDVLQRVGARGLIFHDDFRSVIDSLPLELLRTVKLVPIGSSGHEERYEGDLARAIPDTGPAESLTSTIWFTSGSTGSAKGVRRRETPDERRRHLRFLASLFGFSGRDVLLLSSPLYHTANRHFAFMAVELGATLVVQPRFDPEEFLQLIERHRITGVHLVPTMLYRLLSLDPRRFGEFDISSLTTIIHTAAPCPVTLKRRAIERLGPILHEYYGTTEVGGTYISPTEWEAKPGSVGRVWNADTLLRIVDDQGSELPPEVVGNVALLNTRRSPFSYVGGGDGERTPDGLFITGDLGRLDRGGYLFLADRRASVIRSGGVAIYPAEIEAVIAEHPDVEDTAVLGVPDPEWGERVVALVQPRAGSEIRPSALREHVRAHLAHYKCPRVWLTVDHVPRDTNGKVMRKDLPAELAASASREAPSLFIPDSGT
jgi:long-chain acyl-CoA synthetase